MIQMERLTSSGLSFHPTKPINPHLRGDFLGITRLLSASAPDAINERRRQKEKKAYAKCPGATITKEEIIVY